MRVQGILVAALVASLGVNAWLLLSGSPPTSTRANPSAVSANGKDRDRATPRPAARQCERKLEACEAATKLRPLLFGSGRPYAGSDTRPGDTEEEARQQELLCSIARRQAEDYWRDKELEIVLGLRHSLADDATQERDVKAAVEKYAEHLGLAPEDRADFERRYRAIRLERIGRVKEAMDRDPPDFGAVVSQTRELFMAEDQLAEDMGGAQAARILHDSEREPRAALLSAAATLAGVPWEDALPEP